MIMNVLDALFHTVHDHPGGAEALAPRLGKRGTSLCHEVRPPKGSTAKAGLLDAMKIMSITGDHRAYHAMGSELGYVSVPMPHLDDAHEDTMAQLAVLAREFGEVMHEVAVGGADSVITDNELARLQRQWGELVRAGTVLLATWTAKNAVGKPEAAMAGGEA